nr:DUF4147 domain-containing protein [Hyphomonadaceae bacterium]
MIEATSTSVPVEAGGLLQDLFKTAVKAVDPLTCLTPVLPPANTGGRTCVIAIGKAAGGMALAARRRYGPDVGGLVVVRHGMVVDQAALGEGFEVVHAAHPVPDAASQRAGRRALELAATLGRGDRLLALISGGGSALAEVPVAGLTLDDLRDLTIALLRSGAPIGAINSVRRALSAIKGGGLAAAAGDATVVTCVISDVPGDDVTAIASGPTIASPPGDDQAIAILDRYRLAAPENVRLLLRRADNNSRLIRRDPAPIVAASGAVALAAAAGLARERGIAVSNLGDRLDGEARQLGCDHAALALNLPHRGPALILSGGETTVTATPGASAQGRGGRNLEYLLALAIALDGAASINAIACDTDGLDGSSHAAGAVITPSTLQRARALGIDPDACLRAHDSHGFFEAL